MLDRTRIAATETATTSRNERAGDYHAIVAQIDTRTRVIECSAGIQWIVQRRVGQQWHGRSFCRTKEALLRCVREWVPGEHPALAVLPDRFPEAA